MLSIALCVIGVVLLLAAAVALLVGGALALFIPQLVAGGVLLVVGLAIERWRYKPLRNARPQSGWTDTGERFIDPETGVLTAVWFDPQNGERHYLAAPPRG